MTNSAFEAVSAAEGGLLPASRREVLAGLSALAVAAPLPALASRPTKGPRDAAEFSRFIDGFIVSEMKREQVPGAAFVFVKDGRIFHIKGYGHSDLERNLPVDPYRTIFRIGSVSKLFTAAALLQLADRRRVRMNADVNRYLRKVKVGAEWPQPVTPHHLLSHTAGFDEIRPGTQAASAGQVLPLADFLKGKLVRVRPPGETIAYSTYASTLAGLLVEEVSGRPFEQYLKEEIWDPLGMRRTSITVPAGLSGELATGYELVEGRNQPARWEWYHTTPASSMNSSAADMAAFMIAILQLGRSKGARILSGSMTHEMLRTHATGHPRLPGFAWGFYEDEYRGLRILEHGGNVAGYNCHLALFPEENAGFFIVGHHEQSGLRDQVKWAILQRYYDSGRVHPVPAAGAIVVPGGVERFAGSYGWNTYCYRCQPKRAPSLILKVEARPDGSLSMQGRRWIRTEKMLFVREDGAGHIAFREDERGNITHLFSGGFWVFDRINEAGSR